MTNDCLDYIKETGKEIKELNDKIQSLMNKNEMLMNKIADLEFKVQSKENELKNIRKLANKWWGDYNDLSLRSADIEANYQFLTSSLALAFDKIVKEENKEEVVKDFIDVMLADFKKEYRW